jgi:hypothetical protein
MSCRWSHWFSARRSQLVDSFIEEETNMKKVEKKEQKKKKIE